MNDMIDLFVAAKPTILTFDCYGTLIDWEGGAAKALRDIYGFSQDRVSDDALIDMFLELDAVEIRKGIFPYSRVLQNVADQIAERLLGKADPELGKKFPQSLPTWPVFDETNEALAQLAGHFRLAIISNVDDDLISQTLNNINVSFDKVVTSQQVQSYKPDVSIFEQALHSLDETPGKVIHIAEGLCEARPARALGMKSIWVERSPRSDDKSGASPHAKAPSLMAIVEAANAARQLNGDRKQLKNQPDKENSNHD